jgi:transposase
MSLTDKDFDITEKKIKKYIERRKEKTIVDARLKGLVECPGCGNVYNKLQWGMHKWKELHKTEPRKRKIYINKDKNYKCVINNCDWNGTKCHTHFKTHLMNHGYTALSKSTIPPEITLIIYH